MEDKTSSSKSKYQPNINGINIFLLNNIKKRIKDNTFSADDNNHLGGIIELGVEFRKEFADTYIDFDEFDKSHNELCQYYSFYTDKNKNWGRI